MLFEIGSRITIPILIAFGYIAFHFLFGLLVHLALLRSALQLPGFYVMHNLFGAPFFLHHLAYLTLEARILLMHRVHLV